MINQNKPSTVLANTLRPSQGVTWNTISTTWATEDETWQSASQIIDNVGKPITSMTNQSKPA